jgi:hypothetical protein
MCIPQNEINEQVENFDENAQEFQAWVKNQ